MTPRSWRELACCVIATPLVDGVKESGSARLGLTLPSGTAAFTVGIGLLRKALRTQHLGAAGSR
jgi:hypothetical protein